ncbi:MAG: helicase SNF2 [unclassified Hahellaceae]|nr:helicase SNF2 [Hahellaceae bacterium]|tara:strand:- start:20845 stop:23934 length:3090 start_codon:yes stop_codon:yes gene_type:complete
MAVGVEIGDLVESNKFSGFGKVLSVETDKATVGFFESPFRPESREAAYPHTSLKRARLLDETVVYYKEPANGIFLRCRYGGQRPNDKHLVIVRQGENREVSVGDVYCLNLGQGQQLSASEFLAARCNDAPYFFPFRERFTSAYIEQRAACRSIAAIPSSSVEFEPHQLAVVRRILQDEVQKYLLADEVGLGKTIEACLVIREHLLENKSSANIIISVPASLIEQWREELKGRFHLGELIATEDEPDLPIAICSHQAFSELVASREKPTLIAVDEAHQVAPLAWSENHEERALFGAYSDACQKATVALLLSGTPLNGNEKNFLSMLHCLSPDAYRLDEAGIEAFLAKVSERERLGGMYGAITPETSNATIEEILDELESLFPDDPTLIEEVNSLRPLVDFLAPEKGDERGERIKLLRKYIGEHYRLHQRMLRNRRDNAGLSFLFPGLAGLTRTKWHVEDSIITLDDLIDEYRSSAKTSPEPFLGMDAGQYLSWIDDLLANPDKVGLRATTLLEQESKVLPEAEVEILTELRETATIEQNSKDRALIESLTLWLSQRPEGKAVVFCADPKSASHVYSLLSNQLETIVEVHNPGKVPDFCDSESDVRVLVCDPRGEDGLNLHGGQRLALHYSLSRFFSRIEQRVGRLNRYSANLRGVRPVESLALIPDRPCLSSRWLDLLDNGVGLFDETVASLQYVLEAHLEQTWKKVFQSGDAIFEHSTQELSGENGLLAHERKRVKAQEELMAMDEDVGLAQSFAEQLEDADEVAEQHAHLMAGWITKALRFDLKGSLSGIFRFAFAGETARKGRTLVDLKSFLNTCLTGIDFDNGYPPSTQPMSASRSEVADKHGVFPFRYGQPFVDSIWQLMQEDSRGIASVFLRIFDKLPSPEPRIFFKLNWLVTATSSSDDLMHQRRGDESYPPKIISQWLGEDGQLVSEQLQAILERPYESEGRGGGYQDLNMRASVWHEIEELIPAEDWKTTVFSVEQAGLERVVREIEITEGRMASEMSVQLVSVLSIVLCSLETLQRKGAN